jgi:hypothetical protein
MGQVKDMIGQRFGRLTVLYRNGVRRRGDSNVAAWLCRCDCGRMKTITGNNMRRGDSQSCGCLQRDMTRAYHQRKKEAAK